jgi:integrase
MGFFDTDLRTAYKSEYSSFLKDKNYIEAKVYHGGKSYDLKKRWYVYYSFFNPETNKMERQPPITWEANRKYKTKNERLSYLVSIKDFVNRKLEEGSTPKRIKQQKVKYSAEASIDYAFSVKKKDIKTTTQKNYEFYIDGFKEFLNKKGILNLSIREVNKEHIIGFLKQHDGAKNYNNCKIALNSVFKILSNEGYIEYNFVKEALNRKVTRKPIKLLNDTDIQSIYDLLHEKDKTLLMYSYFVSYMFWRVTEVVRLEVDDFDFKENLVRVETKTSPLKTKIIPNLIIDEIKEFIKDKKGIIFEPDGSDWTNMDIDDRRRHYTWKFSRFRERNNIDKTFKLSHFRLFYITKVYQEIRKTLSKEDAIKKLSLITGHNSKAIYKYILVNDVELPEDYSGLLK